MPPREAVTVVALVNTARVCTWAEFKSLVVLWPLCITNAFAVFTDEIVAVALGAPGPNVIVPLWIDLIPLLRELKVVIVLSPILLLRPKPA